FANSNKEFSLSVSALGEWIHIKSTHISGRYLPELINFEFISKIENKNSFTWNKTIKSKTLDLHINCNLSNEGIYVLQDNDIQLLFSEIGL
ncbi:MAG: hypothetical protein WC343_15435, partial [Bacilli bacterium]